MPKLRSSQHDPKAFEALAREIREAAEELSRVAKAMSISAVRTLEVPFGYEECTKGIVRIRKFALAARDSMLEQRKQRGDFLAKEARK